MALAKLFVKSRKTTMVTGNVSMESMGSAYWVTDYAEGSTLSNLPEQDSFARNMLRRSGFQFELIDLSRGMRAKFSGRLNGIKQTPTLLVGTSPSKRYEGVKEISQFLTEWQSRPIQSLD
jgi:glutaredoxin